MTTSVRLKVTRCGGAIGAVVRGLDLSPDLDDETIEAIKQTLYEHKVIFFRGQSLTDETQAALADRMGPPYENTSLPDEIVKAKSGMYELDGSKPGGRAESWHTDSTFSLQPPAISILRSVTLPVYGGDTTWANCVRAYETLHPALQSLADQLWVVHSNRIDLQGLRPNVSAEELAFFNAVVAAKHVSSRHPLVQVHPKTGRRSLLVGNYAQSIVGIKTSESDHLLSIFQDHITQLENTTRWSWKLGDVVMWDNFATQHKVINDWGDQPRVVRRWTVAGETPVSVAGVLSQSISVA